MNNMLNLILVHHHFKNMNIKEKIIEKKLGLYIHVPFCPKKCPYCDFYSVGYQRELIDKYKTELISRLKNTNYTYDTVYFGGGTPSLLGNERVREILACVNTTKDAEITLESNPNMDFSNYKDSGINRISLGLQSANDDELKFLGRTHTIEQAKRSIDSLSSARISNFSLDLILNLPNMTKNSLTNSVNFCKTQGAKHISSYMLKIEEGTPFYDKRDELNLLDEEKEEELYLFAVQEIEKLGYLQYEISNFAIPNYESKHNTKYWTCDEYLAFGPSAYSFHDGKRYFYPRDLNYFLNGNDEIFEEDGGDTEERIMLGLRLTKGINLNDFSKEISDKMLNRAKTIPQEYISFSNENIKLTPKGFLVSNHIILKVLGY